MCSDADKKWISDVILLYKEYIPLAKRIMYRDVSTMLSLQVAKEIEKSALSPTEAWKTVAMYLGIDQIDQHQEIERAARRTGERPLYVALTIEYPKNCNATLGSLLESLIRMERFDILFLVKDLVREIIYKKQKRNSFSNISLGNPEESECLKENSSYQERHFPNNNYVYNPELSHIENCSFKDDESECSDVCKSFCKIIENDESALAETETNPLCSYISDKNIDILKIMKAPYSETASEDLESNISEILQADSELAEESDESNTECNTDNIVNENIEELVAEKDKCIRSVERMERQSASVICIQKPKLDVITTHNKLFSCLNKMLQIPSSVSDEELIKILVLHADKDSTLGVELSKKFCEDFRFKAVSDYELGAIWVVDSYDYREEALNWADILVIIITDTWLDDIENAENPSERPASSLDARYTYKLLQNKYVNSGSINLQVIAVVMEGTSSRFRNHPAIPRPILLWRDYSRLEGIIRSFHQITRAMSQV